LPRIYIKETGSVRKRIKMTDQERALVEALRLTWPSSKDSWL